MLYLILIMGINGMVMTRDLFNQFVFLEIMSIGTYGLLGLERTPTALAASFKYIMATVLASSFFLLGAGLLYHVTGTLNIDGMIADRTAITGPIGTTALLFVLACLVLELKPFPANGWGLDVYETATSGIAALVSVGVSAGVFFALFKLLPLFEDHLGILAISGGITFLFSNLVGLRQTSVQRMLGYSSIAQMGLLMLALALLHQLGAEQALPLVVGGLFVNHLFAKAGLFWLAGIVERREIDDWSDVAGNPLRSFPPCGVPRRDCRPAAISRLLGEMGTRDAGCGGRSDISGLPSSSPGRCLRQPTCSSWFKQATRPLTRAEAPVERERRAG